MTEPDEKGAGHVSTFELDVHWAAGCPEGSSTGEHVAGCAPCRGYLEELRAAADRGTPGWKEPRVRSRGSPLRWSVAIAGALALAASVALTMRAHPPPEKGYVASKGTPAVEILVHRARETFVWDPRSPVQPGDTLALRVACEGLDHVAVAAPGDHGWSRLSEVTCPQSGEPLPFTLRVDEQPGDEKLAVVLSHGALADVALERAISESQRTGDVWVVSFVLSKVAAPR